jgi:hypothetical protein
MYVTSDKGAVRSILMLREWLVICYESLARLHNNRAKDVLVLTQIEGRVARSKKSECEYKFELRIAWLRAK